MPKPHTLSRCGSATSVCSAQNYTRSQPHQSPVAAPGWTCSRPGGSGPACLRHGEREGKMDDPRWTVFKGQQAAPEHTRHQALEGQPAQQPACCNLAGWAQDKMTRKSWGTETADSATSRPLTCAVSLGPQAWAATWPATMADICTVIACIPSIARRNDQLAGIHGSFSSHNRQLLQRCLGAHAHSLAVHLVCAPCLTDICPPATATCGSTM